VTVWLPPEPGLTAFLEQDDAARRARAAGVTFVRLAENALPAVRLTEGTVLCADSVAGGTTIEPPAVDVLVLVTPNVPNDGTKELADLLRVSLTRDGFFSVSDRALHPEAHLRPLDFTRGGIFVCGEANGAHSFAETISQAYGAAARAAALLSQPTRMVGGSISEVDQSACITCLTCVRVCPIGVPVIDPQAQKAYIEPQLCKGCGICASQCPVHAITLHHATNPQMFASEEALLTR
jgi:heterodisulfide reductase subunit A